MIVYIENEIFLYISPRNKNEYNKISRYKINKHISVFLYTSNRDADIQISNILLIPVTQTITEL